jgi:competence protein ComGC
MLRGIRSRGRWLMALAGYCNQCRESVWLNADGSCPRGHGAENISGAYEAGPPPAFVQQPAQYAQQPGQFPPQATQYPMPSGQSRPGVVIGVVLVVVVGLLFMCGVLASIAIPTFNNAKTSATERACFANQRAVYFASQAYTADKGKPPAALRELIDEGLISEDPVCPSQGTYTWDQTTGKITCSVHGAFPSSGTEIPSRNSEPPTQ